ncbi:MAG: hypothetical protein K6A37_04295 [Saccharofermentans sp.]|nr:hypothetical protein [Saccharofermentans sp.]
MSNNVLEKYTPVFSKVSSINSEIKRAEEQKEIIKKNFSEEVVQRIEKLDESLKKIDVYLDKIEAFQLLAEKNLDSKNVLTIVAPPGYKVSLDRLHNWAQMIDPNSPNDPFAQRVYSVAKCDEKFLLEKQREFIERKAFLEKQKDDGADEEVRSLELRIEQLKAELKSYALSAEVAELTETVVKANREYNFTIAPSEYIPKQVIPEKIFPGAYLAPLPFAKEQRVQLHNMMGDGYDPESGLLSVPVDLNNSTEYIMNIMCSPKRNIREKLYKALQNLIVSSIDNNPAGTRRIYFFDAARFMPSSLGSLRKIEDKVPYVLAPVPTSLDQLTESLEKIVSGFADTDEILGGFDSVAAYNSSVEDLSKRLPMSTIILLGWPSSYEGRNLELVQRIMNSYERYGISIITVAYKSSDDGKEDSKMPEFAYQSAITVRMFNNRSTIQFPDGNEQYFKWYLFNDELSDTYALSLKENIADRESKGNEYINRYSISAFPSYTRAYKEITFPFGIDGKDEDHSISFENENFATFLMGASRSGKSTLLHTLIAGMVYNYHPDNLEIWMADFKQLEFKSYFDHLPPHVKYVLLDESNELVFDLIDKLTEEMMKRQKLFSREHKDKINQFDVTKLDKPLPVIFVILDEFSIMSQVIEDTPYQLKLQNLLAKGAALGIKFLFASQTFTTGVRGLTKTARAQIQQRIAMKASKEEIVETLELSANQKTEQVKNWMDALPPHYALVKCRKGPDLPPEVKRYLVMYFKDYAVRNDMIDMISSRMVKSTTYNPSDINTYVDKDPTLVDGNSYSMFPVTDFIKKLKEEKKESEKAAAARGTKAVKEDLSVTFGVPRLMDRLKITKLTRETRENILLISKHNEADCTASIIMSVIKSLHVQNRKVQIWAYEKNPIYIKHIDTFKKKNVTVLAGMDEICDGIKNIKSMIRNKKNEDMVIILLGMERICMDFSYIDNGSGKPTYKRATVNPVYTSSEVAADSLEEQIAVKYSIAWFDKMKEIKASHPELSEEELNHLYDEEEKTFKAQKTEEIKTRLLEKERRQQDDSSGASGAYDALADFEFVVKQGSRFGIHFMLNLGAVDDVKTCGLRTDYFRYRMTFMLSKEDAMKLYNEIRMGRITSTLPERVCQYNDSLSSYSFRPYIQEKIDWDGWFVDDDGHLVSPYDNNTKEK